MKVTKLEKLAISLLEGDASTAALSWPQSQWSWVAQMD